MAKKRGSRGAQSSLQEIQTRDRPLRTRSSFDQRRLPLPLSPSLFHHPFLISSRRIVRDDTTLAKLSLQSQRCRFYFRSNYLEIYANTSGNSWIDKNGYSMTTRDSGGEKERVVREKLINSKLLKKINGVTCFIYVSSNEERNDTRSWSFDSSNLHFTGERIHTHQFPRLLCRGRREAVTDDHEVILDVTPCGKKCLELVKLVPRDPCQLIYASHALDSSLKLLVPCRLIPLNGGTWKEARIRERRNCTVATYVQRKRIFLYKRNSWSILNSLRALSPFDFDLGSRWRKETLKIGISAFPQFHRSV